MTGNRNRMCQETTLLPSVKLEKEIIARGYFPTICTTAGWTDSKTSYRKWGLVNLRGGVNLDALEGEAFWLDQALVEVSPKVGHAAELFFHQLAHPEGQVRFHRLLGTYGTCVQSLERTGIDASLPKAVLVDDSRR